MPIHKNLKLSPTVVVDYRRKWSVEDVTSCDVILINVDFAHFLCELDCAVQFRVVRVHLVKISKNLETASACQSVRMCLPEDAYRYSLPSTSLLLDNININMSQFFEAQCHEKKLTSFLVVCFFLCVVFLSLSLSPFFFRERHFKKISYYEWRTASLSRELKRSSFCRCRVSTKMFAVYSCVT